ncbi:MAG: hypothetical protein JZD41_06220, partial [Thermoproteus sp.]|nr:hypothetical protein [Thermoproteus sp.]
GLNFGAKKSRHTPFFELLSGVGAVSKPVSFSVSPPRVRAGYNFIDDTIKRACKAAAALKPYGESIAVYYFNKEGFKIGEGGKETSSGGCALDNMKAEKVDEFADLMSKIKEYVLMRLKPGP